MAAYTPTIRRVSWFPILAQILIIGLIVYLFHLAGFSAPFLFGAITYSILAFVLRKSIGKDHRKGISLVRQQKFAEAIPFFEKSVAFFIKNGWLDKYRFLTLLSASKMTYQEMGLCNIAFCYSQVGNGQKAKEYYEKVVKEFPDNGLAISGLKMLNSVK